MPTMPPVSLRATAATKTTLAIVWGAPESGTTPTAYEVRVDTGTPVNVGLTNSHILGSLTADTSYEIGVRTLSADGPSSWATRTMETVAHLREHFYRPVRNGDGALMVGSTVAVYKTGTTVPPDIPIYFGPTGDQQRAPAWLMEEGVVDFYVDLPQIVDIVVTVPGRADPITFPHQWVGDILDVDLTNDTVMTAIDSDVNAQFRVQQDARHAGAYADKATQTTVETGRLSSASQDAAYAAKSTQTTVETGRLSTASLDTAYASNSTLAASAADLGDDTSPINTTGKRAGRPGYDSTGNRPVWATGTAPTSTWVYADGTTAFTPV